MAGNTTIVPENSWIYDGRSCLLGYGMNVDQSLEILRFAGQKTQEKERKEKERKYERRKEE